MKLIQKFWVIYLVSLVLLAAGFGFFQRASILDNFLALEESQMRADLDRAQAALNQVLAKLSTTVIDWAPWDDTYQFVHGENPSYPKENLTSPTVLNLQLNLMVFLDASGEVFHKLYYDLDHQEFLTLPDNLLASILEHSDMLSMTTSDGARDGIIDTPSGLLLVAVHPILKNDFSGPARGMLLVGQFLDERLVELLSKATGLEITVQPAIGNNLELGETVLSALSERHGSIVEENGLAKITAARLLYDPAGRPTGIMKIAKPRDIYRQGLATAAESFWWVLGTGLLFALVGGLMLNHMVLSRWSDLEKEVEKIGRTEDLDRRLVVKSRDELGKLAETINLMLDRLREAHQKQRESEVRFNQAFEHAALGMALTDIEGRFMDVNPYLCQVLGYSKEELLGMKFNDITDPEDQQIGLSAINRTLSGASDYVWFEIRYRNKDGRVVWAMVSVALIRDDDRKPLYHVTHIQDITQSKAAILDLIENQKRVQALADNLPVFIGQVDANHRYRFVNRIYAEWFGCSREDIIGRHVSEILGQEGYEVIRPKLEEALSGQMSFSKDLLTTRQGPKLFYSRYIPHLDEGGHVVGYYFWFIRLKRTLPHGKP